MFLPVGPLPGHFQTHSSVFFTVPSFFCNRICVVASLDQGYITVSSLYLSFDGNQKSFVVKYLLTIFILLLLLTLFLNCEINSILENQHYCCCQRSRPPRIFVSFSKIFRPRSHRRGVVAGCDHR